MAEKRMFTKKIIDSDAFLTMPLSAQALYFHLNMRADDDGFVNNPVRLTDYVKASFDDLKLLMAKRFIIGFDSGVIVIKHWRMHNTLKSDRYTPTDYQEEFQTLMIKANKSYTEKAELPNLPSGNEEWNQNGSTPVPQNREGSDSDSEEIQDSFRSGEDITVSHDTVCRTKDVRRIVDAWNQLGLSQVSKCSSDSKRGGLLRARVKEYGVDGVLTAIQRISESAFLRGQNKNGWIITFDWFLKPNNFVKVFEGNYDNRNTSGNGSGTPLDDLRSLHEMYAAEEDQL